MLRLRSFPITSRSRTKFAVAWISIVEGWTGTMMECARATISCRRRPDAPAGPSITSWRVPSGTCMPMLRRPVFCGAALAPWILGARSTRSRSQLSDEPCGSKSMTAVGIRFAAK
jgi:hypothetical protein